MQVRFGRSGAVPEIQFLTRSLQGMLSRCSRACWSVGGALRNGPGTHLVAWEWELASLALWKA